AFQCYRGRGELDVVTQVETIDANRGLREHYGCLTHAISMLEASDQVAQDREPNPALYRMLAGALRTLAAEPSPLVSAAFFWKLLSLEGFHPMLDECARCGDESGPFPAFDLLEGGVLCESCGQLGGRRLTPEALALVRRILGGELRSALAEPPSATTVDVERLALAALEHHIERHLRSAALL
ncbi:MAG TPA: DNA repair protein RecO, partial [Acidimicrobiia bacterium]|nr:DNA repair protein RecO [Acidimicrobiia bacterium]